MRKCSTPNTRPDGPADDVCPACQRLAGDAFDYFRHAFADGEAPDLAAEALAEALGYCPTHSALLQAHPEYAAASARVFGLACERILRWLDETHLHEEQVQRVFFLSAGNCPACRFEHQRSARQTGSLARSTVATQPDALCLEHFRAAVTSLRIDARIEALARGLGRLEDEVEKFVAERTPLAATLSYVAGRPPVSSPLIAPPPGIALAGVFDDEVDCPICHEEDCARERWLDNVRRAAGFGGDGWLFFPTCPPHLHEIAAHGDLPVTRAMLGNALANASGKLRRDIDLLVRQLRHQNEEVTLRSWTPRRRRKRDPALPPAPAPARHSIACPGCEWLHIARDRAVGRLLERLEKRRRPTGNDGADLCMRHFAAACLLAPKGAIRTTLIRGQREKLERAMTMLSTQSPPERRQEASQTALYLFCGQHAQCSFPAR